MIPASPSWVVHVYALDLDERFTVTDLYTQANYEIDTVEITVIPNAVPDVQMKGYKLRKSGQRYGSNAYGVVVPGDDVVAKIRENFLKTS